MYSTDRKYFRFHMFIFVFVAFSVSLVNCSSKKQTTLSCLKVASNVKSFLVDKDATKLDAQFLSDFVDCVQDLHKLYKTTDWATVQKTIPEMGIFIKEITPQMAKKMLSLTGKAGFQFASAYVFYKTVELHARAVELESADSEFYRKEFEYLQSTKIQPLLKRINRDVMPLLGSLDSATLKKLAESIIEDLDYHTKELKAISRTVYQDVKDACSNKAWSLGYGVGAASLCVGSLFFGQPYLAVVPCSLAFPSVGFNTYNFYSFSDSGQKLLVLIEDVELLCNEVEDYIIYLKDACHVY